MEQSRYVRRAIVKAPPPRARPPCARARSANHTTTAPTAYNNQHTPTPRAGGDGERRRATDTDPASTHTAVGSPHSTHLHENGEGLARDQLRGRAAAAAARLRRAAAHGVRRRLERTARVDLRGLACTTTR